MERDDILELEKQLDLLEKESKILEETFNNKDLDKFKPSKQNMLRAQSKIRKITL